MMRNTNVCKWTLMNALHGEMWWRIWSTGQTTLDTIRVIHSSVDLPIHYSDRPGFLKPGYQLQKSMLKYVKGAITYSDVIRKVLDTVKMGEASAEIRDRISPSVFTTIVVMNKVYLNTPKALEALDATWKGKMPKALIQPASGKESFNFIWLFKSSLELSSEDRAYYAKNTLTAKSLAYFVTEIRRDKSLTFDATKIPNCRECECER